MNLKPIVLFLPSINFCCVSISKRLKLLKAKSSWKSEAYLGHSKSGVKDMSFGCKLIVKREHSHEAISKVSFSILWSFFLEDSSRAPQLSYASFIACSFSMIVFTDCALSSWIVFKSSSYLAWEAFFSAKSLSIFLSCSRITLSFSATRFSTSF